MSREELPLKCNLHSRDTHIRPFTLWKQTQSVSKSKSQHHDFILSEAIFHEWRGNIQHTYMENARKPTSTTILSKAEKNEGNTSQRNQHKCEPSEGGDLEVGLERRPVIARHFSH